MLVTRLRLIGFLVPMLMLVALRAHGAGVFDLSRGPAVRAVVTIGPSEPELAEFERSVEMWRTLHGVLAELGPKQLVELRKSQGQRVDSPTKPESVFAFVHLHGSPGPDGKEETKIVRLLRRDEGDVVAEEMDKVGRRFLLKELEFAAIAMEWTAFRGKADAPETRGGQTLELEKPYAASLFPITPRVLGDRLMAGGTTTLKATTRELEKAKIWCRLPKGYKAGRAAGLIVWCDASPSGKPPASLASICDELGFISVGAADAGNDRPSVDRYQLALDAMENARERFVIDDQRVYTSGISGGARIASTLGGCFPDVFAGSVPIVGLACFENVPNGLGQLWPGAFRKPLPKRFALLKTRRIGVITGEQDFNYPEITAAAKIYQREACDLRVFSTPTMGHQMASEAQFTEALRWVDEAAAERRRGELERGKELLAKASDGNRAALFAVLQASPWSDEAWVAVETLKGPRNQP